VRYGGPLVGGPFLLNTRREKLHSYDTLIHKEREGIYFRGN